jgi:hypothetical protein
VTSTATPLLLLLSHLPPTEVDTSDPNAGDDEHKEENNSRLGFR